MNKVIGILAHVDAGKTTFSESILYHTNSIRQKGRVDHQNTYLDYHPIEQERGITVWSEQGIFHYKEDTYYLLDTPGHVDFSQEMERAIKVMDYAIILLSAVEGIQGHTETVWELLRKYHIPTFFFINKIDRIGSNVEGVLEEIKKQLSPTICMLTNQMEKGSWGVELIEAVAEQDEVLLERYMEEDYEEEAWKNGLKKLIKEEKLFPCAIGSALQDEGIVEFLEQLSELTYTYEEKGEHFLGKVYKIRHDETKQRWIHLKVIEGTLKVKQEINGEKVNQLRRYNGIKYEAVTEAKQGELIAVLGPTLLNLEDDYEMIPTLRSQVIFDETFSPRDVLSCFKMLEAEDPTLNVEWNEALKAIHIQVMGTIQLEVLKEVVRNRFGIVIDFGTCEIVYKEMIQEKTIGCGHFEPLKHYAEVHLRLIPTGIHTGITFKSSVHVDRLPQNYQNLVRTHVFEREHRGILTGSSITNMQIELIAGNYHNKHTSGGDFREATYRAMRQGLEQVKNILLEPYYAFKIEVPTEYIGRVITDVQKASGIGAVPETSGERSILRGKVPVATFINYSIELAAFSKGKGSISLKVIGYDRCHNQEEVIQKIGYDKEKDLEYTAHSIFCSKGTGYIVRSEVAREHMHVKSIQ